MGANARTRPLRVSLYARVSTRDKDQDPELQLQPLRECAAARGWQPTEYVDHASAADLARRRGRARLPDDARRRRLDHVLAWKLDRPFRSTLHCLRTLDALAHRGVGFACLTQEIDTTSPTGRLLLTILAAVAELERGLIAERVREGMANARRKGARLGRPAAIERPHVARQWPAVRAQLAAGALRKEAFAARPATAAQPVPQTLSCTRRPRSLLGGAPASGRGVLASGARQVVFGLAAAGLTFAIGRLIGVSLAG